MYLAFTQLLSQIRLQIHEKPTIQIRKSPRQSPMKRTNITMPPNDPVLSNETRIDILNQDWDDDTSDLMDISSNIQDILNGLTEEDTANKESEKPQRPTENKENLESNKLFPLFYNPLQVSKPK